MQVQTRMTSAEFAEFARLPQNADKRLQLIDGEIFMAARPIPDHQRFIVGVFELVDELMPGGEAFIEVNLHLAEGQNYELDVIWIAPDSTCQETPTGFEGAPWWSKYCPAAPLISIKAVNSMPTSVMG